MTATTADRATEYTAFDLRTGLPAGCRDFLAANAHGLFTDPDWLALFARSACDPDLVPQIVCALNAQGIDLALPLVRKQLVTAGLPVPMLTSLTNFYSLDFRPLSAGGRLRPGDGARVAGALRSVSGRLIRLDPLDETVAGQLEQELRQAGMTTYRYSAFGNWIERVGQRSFEAYFAERPSQLKNTYRRRNTKLRKAHPVTIRLSDGRGDDRAAIRDAYLAVYAKSWKVPEPYPDFIPGLIDLAAQRGWLRLGVLFVGELPVAAQLWLCQGDTSLIYKLAYDEDYKEFSPGLILTVEMFRQAIDVDRSAIIDYGSGDDPYKRDWMSERRQYWGLEVYDTRSLAGWAIHAAKRLRDRFRKPAAPAATDIAADVAAAAPSGGNLVENGGEPSGQRAA